MDNKLRTILGVIFGMLLGLAYALVSQWINNIFMPGIPLYVPPPGRFAIIILVILAGGVLGFLVAWPKEFFVGVIISASVGTLASSFLSLRAVTGGFENMVNASVVLFISFLPRVVLFLPVVILVRWAAETWEKETLYDSYSVKGRVRSLLLLVIVGLLAGVFSLYSANTRRSLANLNELILEGRQASSITNLPQPLQIVDGFLEHSNSSYAFNVVVNPEDIPVSQPGSGYDQNVVGIDVLFTSGFRFGCVYRSPDEPPNCIRY